MPTQPPTDHLSPHPLSDARDLHASIAALRLLLAAQGRQFEALERRLSPARNPADTGAMRLRALKVEGF